MSTHMFSMHVSAFQCPEKGLPGIITRGCLTWKALVSCNLKEEVEMFRDFKVRLNVYVELQLEQYAVVKNPVAEGVVRHLHKIQCTPPV